MAKKKFDPDLIRQLVTQGRAEVSKAEPPKPVAQAKPEAPKVEPARPRVSAQPESAEKPTTARAPKGYLTVNLTEDVLSALYAFHGEYRATIAKPRHLHPGIGGAVEHLLRKALELPPL